MAQWLPAEEALTVAHGIGDASARARALAKVAQRLPTEEALAVANGIGDAGARARALAEVAQRLPTEEALAVARSIGDAGARARALAEVALQLPTEEALAVARGIGDPGACARALAEISQRLPVEEALTVARGIDDPWPRAWVLAEVEKRLPAKEQWRVLREALSAASSINDNGARAPVLMEIAQRLWEEEKPRVLREALRAVNRINDFEQRYRALTEVLQRLPAEEALGVARDVVDPSPRARALAEVAKRLPPVEALAVARGIDDPWMRAGALAEAAQRLPAGEQPGVLREALRTVRGMQYNAGWLAGALAEVARRLSAEQQPEVLREALDVACGIGDTRSRARALAGVAPRLPREEALAVARGIYDAESRSEALAAIAMRMPSEEALAVARSIDDGRVRAEALSEVAQRLVLGKISHSSMHEWVETAPRAIGDDGRMARASAADRLNRGAGVGGRFPDRTPALEFGGEGGLFLFPGADRIRAEHEAQRRIVAFDRGDHGLRRPGGIAGLLAVAAIEVGFEGIDERPVGVETALGPHVDRACELGPERAGLDDRHADAEGPHLVPQRLAPAFQREFRRAVGAESADGKESADAGELEDVSACLRAHRGQHETRHLGGREKVDLHLLAQLLRRKLLDRAERAAPRDVGQDVDAPETVKRGFDGCLARLRVRDVEPDGKRRLRICGRHRFEGRDPARRKDGAVPAPENRFGQRAAEAARSSRDEPDPLHRRL